MSSGGCQLSAMAGVLLGLAALAALPASGAAQDAGWRYRRLDLDITTDPARSILEVRGRAVLEVTAATVSELELGVNTRVHAFAFRDVSTTRPGTRVSLAADSVLDRARIVLSEPLTRGDKLPVEFELEWLEPSFQVVAADSIVLASWVEAWYPIPLGPGGAMRPWAAPGQTRFRLPPGWRAVTNGALLSTTTLPDGGMAEVWETLDAVHRSFVAGPYRVARAEVGGREVGVYLLHADTASARRQASTLAQAIEAMERVWGPYPYAGYAIAELPQTAVTWSASSEQGFIMATSSQFGADGNLPLFAHEAAHGWWGNRVQTTGAGAQLLSESLAQYGAVVAIEGVDAMREFLRFSRRGYNQLQSAAGYFEIVRRGGDRPLAELANGAWDHNLSDSKGHWFYHMLRQRVGDERFFSVLRELQRAHAGRTLSLDELRAAFVSDAPDAAAMAEFLAQWLDRTGAPVLKHRWWSSNGGAAVDIELAQLQPQLYDVPLTIEIRLQNGHRVRRTLQLRDRAQSFTIPVHARAVAVRTDPDHQLLHWRPEYGPVPLDAQRAGDTPAPGAAR